MRFSIFSKRLLSFICAFILAFGFFAVPSAKPAEVKAAFRSEYEPVCETAYMMSMDTGKVIFEKDGDKKMLPASLTKMMTCIIAYERADSLDEMVVVDSRAVRFVNYNKEGATGVWTNIKVNERFTLKDLIYNALVASENCAAEAIGYYISKQYYGSDTNEEFIQFMNDRATEIGCTNTKFKCASGLTTDFENHYSSAHDMALIANHLMNIPELVLIREGEKGADGTDYFYQYCEGVKTGYLIKSGHCFAGYAKKNVGGRDYHYIVVLLNDHAPSAKDKNYAFIDAKNLFEWAFNNLYITDIYNTNVSISKIPLKLAWNKDSITLVPQDDFSTILPKGVKATSVSKEITFVNDVARAPVRKGQKLGTAVLTYDGEEIGRINLVASESVERSTLLAILDWVNNLFASLIFRIFLVLAVLGVVAYIFISYSRKQKMNNLKRSVSRRKATRRTYR